MAYRQSLADPMTGAEGGATFASGRVSFLDAYETITIQMKGKQDEAFLRSSLVPRSEILLTCLLEKICVHMQFRLIMYYICRGQSKGQ